MRGKPNIWTLAVRQQQYQIDVRSVEELFGQQEDAGVARAAGVAGVAGQTQIAGVPARVSRSRSFKESTKDEVRDGRNPHQQLSQVFFEGTTKQHLPPKSPKL